jgi:signal transduction histidine kinase/ActR/RegA family two-component response regulator
MIEKAGTAPIHSKHHVQFYENEEFLVGVVARFLRDGLTAGDPLVVIASSDHREKFTAAIKDEGLEVNHHIELGQLIFLDAQETLSTFMVNGMPDRQSFQEHVGAVVEKARAGRPGVTVRAFGEMVDLLWRQGNARAAVRLEELWNELATIHEFSLLCAYTMGNFSGVAHSQKFESVCQQHARVMPTEMYINALDDEARLREISLLQQRARSLESEIERRKALEANLCDMVLRETAARNDAENAGRLKDEFLAILSHELRTPLNAILGWTQIIDARNDQATMARAMEVIKRNAKLQLNLINDLLDVSRIITGKMMIKTEPVDLEQVIRASLDTVRPSALTKGVEVDVMVEEPAPFITGDSDRLQQVVWNLLTNAIKFTRKGGRVQLQLQQDDSEIQIIVRDTGVGIDPEFLPYVFDRFRQADTGTTRKLGGLGLGLAVVRYLVEAHGGSVSAESPGVGLGATFTVKFPISVAEQQTRPEGQAENSATLGGCRILVIDDERDTCDLFRYILEDCGAEVAVARSADEALEILPTKPFDLVLADIGMPAKDGFAMISAVRAHPVSHVRGVRAIAVTSYAVEHFRTRALSAGFDDYITKPIQPTQLTRLVAEHLPRRVA